MTFRIPGLKKIHTAWAMTATIVLLSAVTQRDQPSFCDVPTKDGAELIIDNSDSGYSESESIQNGRMNK